MIESILQDDQLVLYLPADMTQAEAKPLGKLVQKYVDQGVRKVVVDAAKLTYIDSFSIGTLVNSLKRLRLAGGDLVINNLWGDARELFETTGLDRLFRCFNEDIDAAQESDLFRHNLDMKLDIQYESVEGIGVFRLYGIINNRDAMRKLKENYLLALAQNKKIVFDFENLAYFDTNTVPEMLNFCRILRTSDGELRVCNANALIRQLFEKLHLKSEIPTYDTFKEAMEEAWKR